MDCSGLRTRIHYGIAPSLSVNGYLDVRSDPLRVSAAGRSGATEKSLNKNTVSRFSFKYPLNSMWRGGRNGSYNGLAVEDTVWVENCERKAVEEDGMTMVSEEGGNENWVLKILHVSSLWKEDQRESCVNIEDVKTETAHEASVEEVVGIINDQSSEYDGKEEKEVACDCYEVVDDDNDEKEVLIDKDSFLGLLRKVSLAEANLYAQMSYLGNLAYCIPKIKPGNLLKTQGLRLITSSVAKKMSSESHKEPNIKDDTEHKGEKRSGSMIDASAAYDFASSAAAYLHSQTKSILPFKPSQIKVGESPHDGRHESGDIGNITDEGKTSFKATTDSVTSVVAAKEEAKQAVADDLKSPCWSPCEWFVCDDDQSGTRIFVIQGSETLASWQANLLFEPVQFEGMGVSVHRGIYEAAKGMYEQMLPEVQEHLKSRGYNSTFRFTGHSLGGSLALLVNLMLLIRKDVPASTLLPVITFGSPYIMCGGDSLLDRLGLPGSHVQAITMHRDIVPRVFSCKYPGHVAELLKAINGNFRNHPCLKNQNLLYGPMGKFLILQPDEKFSPHHHLLPRGSGLYVLSSPFSESDDADKQLMAAKLFFLNSPHPLEILSDRSAYGLEGTILRDHDMLFYLKSLRRVILQERNRIHKMREQNSKMWWPLLALRMNGTDVLVGGSQLVSSIMHENNSNLSGILETGRQSIKQLSRLVTSQGMHTFLVLLLPAKLLLLAAYSIIRFR